MSSATSGERAHILVGALTATMDATAVPHEPAPSTATRGCLRPIRTHSQSGSPGEVGRAYLVMVADSIFVPWGYRRRIPGAATVEERTRTSTEALLEQLRSGPSGPQIAA